MSFDLIRSRFQHDPDFPEQRYADLSERLALLDGTFYDNQPFKYFHEQVLPDGKTYISQWDRKPNVPGGTTEIRTQLSRHVSMLYGDQQFPEVVTENADTRRFLKDWIREAGLVETERQAAYQGSVGSVAKQLVVLGEPGKPASMWVKVHDTLYLTPSFDPYRPNVVTKMRFKRKYLGSQLAEMEPAYPIAADDLNKEFWFQIVWDAQAEWWYQPWTRAQVEEAKRLRKPFVPQIDEARSVKHDHGFCPWDWVKNPVGIPQGIDGGCSFADAWGPAISKDFLDSSIQLAVAYNLNPTLVVSTPEATEDLGGADDATPTTSGEMGMAKMAGAMIETNEKGKVYFAETKGDSVKMGQIESEILRKAIIEAMHGDRVDPKEVTNGHQGAKSLEMLNNPMIMHVGKLRKAYGDSFLRILKMALRVVEKCDVAVYGKPVDKKVVDAADLHLRFGEYYTPTAAEKLAQAQADDQNIRNGTISRETALDNIAGDYGVENVPSELSRIAAERKAEDARMIALAKATAAQGQAKVVENLEQ